MFIEETLGDIFKASLTPNQKKLIEVKEKLKNFEDNFKYEDYTHNDKGEVGYIRHPTIRSLEGKILNLSKKAFIDFFGEFTKNEENIRNDSFYSIPIKTYSTPIKLILVRRHNDFDLMFSLDIILLEQEYYLRCYSIVQNSVCFIGVNNLVIL
jgi:hypothetical protein